MSLFERVADLPLAVEGHDRTTDERATSSGFDRTTTTFALRGAGATGRGEDVTYDTEDHEGLRDHEIDLAGEYTFAEFSARLDDVSLFPEPPEREPSRHYRRWAVESAALDLALRQAGTDLASALGRSYDPVRFVVSTRLGDDDPSTDRLDRLLEAYPDTEFKLDPTDAWDDALVDALGDYPVRIVDLKGQYRGTDVDQAPDSALYERVIDGFPDAVVEDPSLTDATRPVVERASDRLSWDAPITGVQSVRALPFEPSWLNVKPSRFGTVESLFETIEYASDRGVSLYGGGQFELGVGRGQIQALAALFSPDGPNDVAPAGYNEADAPAGLATSPLTPPEEPIGFGW
jgi:hypothetical protein